MSLLAKKVCVLVICAMFTTLLTPYRRTSSQTKPTPLSSTSTHAQARHVPGHLLPEAHLQSGTTRMAVWPVFPHVLSALKKRRHSCSFRDKEGHFFSITKKALPFFNQESDINFLSSKKGATMVPSNKMRYYFSLHTQTKRDHIPPPKNKLPFSLL